MDESQLNQPFRKDKKLVDLIYLDKYRDNKDLESVYQAKIRVWLEWINKKLDMVAFEGIEGEEQAECFAVNHCLRQFLVKRFHWILETVSDPELKKKYLLVLPPFNQQGSIKSFLLHFFKYTDRREQREIEFVSLNDSEKEIRILWDIYKLVKTIDTVAVLKRSIAGSNPFTSQFSSEYVTTTLETIENMLNLLIQICVKPEQYHTLRHQFPLGVFEPEPILNRKENKSFLINAKTIEKFDYRNYFFHIYFKPSMKAKYKGTDLTFKYNYLDFEIMRQEFLMHWVHSRLKNNPKKMSILDNYMFGDRTFSDIIRQSPEMEIQLLKQLPSAVFNDLIAYVNDAVDSEDKTEVESFSQKTGEYAKQFQLFGIAKEITQKTTQAIRDYVSSLKENITKTIKESLPSSESTPEVETPTQKSSFQVKLLKKGEINFPFFHQNPDDYEEHLEQFEKSLTSAQLENFNKKVIKHLSSIEEDCIVKRQTPRQERVIPYLVKEKTNHGILMQILMIGVDAKGNHPETGGASGQPGTGKSTPYFVYGSKVRNFEMGETAESRSIMDKPFFIYQPIFSEVVKKALLLVDIVMEEI